MEKAGRGKKLFQKMMKIGNVFSGDYVQGEHADYIQKGEKLCGILTFMLENPIIFMV